MSRFCSGFMAIKILGKGNTSQKALCRFNLTGLNPKAASFSNNLRVVWLTRTFRCQDR